MRIYCGYSIYNNRPSIWSTTVNATFQWRRQRNLLGIRYSSLTCSCLGKSYITSFNLSVVLHHKCIGSKQFKTEMKEKFWPCHNVIWKCGLFWNAWRSCFATGPFFITSGSLWCSLTNSITCSPQENDKLGSAIKLTKKHTPSLSYFKCSLCTKNQFILFSRKHPF